MWAEIDDDEWEVFVTRTPCTGCEGDPLRCRPGRCNGSFGMGQRRREPAEVARIRAERRQAHEDAILAEAEQIRRRRGL